MRAWIALLILLAGGCAVRGPDYQPPKEIAPGGWRSTDVFARIGGEKIPEMAWWSRFRDPLLLALVDKALERNNTIQSAIGAVYKAKAILLQIQMNWVPTVHAGAGYISNAYDRNNSTGASLPFPGGFSAGFIPNYSLNILQQLRTQEQAEANITASVAAKNAVRLAIIGQVVGSYFGLREEEYRLVQQKQLVTNLLEVVSRYAEAHREGLISYFTLQQYQIELARAQAEVPVIEYNIVRLGNTIHVLLNENPGPIPPGHGFMAMQYRGIVSGSLPSTVLRNRPDVIHAEATLRQSNANIGVNTSVFFPTIKLTTPLGLSSNSLSNLFTAKESYWQYQGGFNMPIIDLGAFGAIKSAKGQYYSDYYAYFETVRNAFAAVDSALASNQKYTDSLESILGFLETTRSRLDNEQLRYEGGLVPYPAVLALRVNLNQAAIEAAQSKLEQLMSIVNLYQELGGGYGYKNNENANDLGEGHRFGDLF